MVSLRRYISIVLIFLAVLLLFQGLQLGRDYISEIHVNKHVSQAGLKASDVRHTDPLVEFSEKLISEQFPDTPYLMYIGSLDSPYLETVEEWAAYMGKTIFHYGILAPIETENLPELILLSPECMAGRADALEWFTSRGTYVVCLGMPDVNVIKNDEDLMRILGILSVHQDEVTLSGIHLFEGFLLGGTRIYEAEDENDTRQDLELTVPWYITREKTKTFMRGILNDEDKKAADALRLENEDMPSLIWASHINKGEIYVVCGDYFADRSIALGILSAVEYERSEYYLYPVINAQVLSMIDYPIASDENSAQMMEVYGRELTKFEGDIIVPQLQTLASRHKYRASCFMAAKFDYDDPAGIKEDFIHHYLAILHDTEGELGLTTHYKGNVTLGQKLDADDRFYTSEDSDYSIHGAYAESEELDEVLRLVPEHPSWRSVHTLSVSPAEDLPLLGFVTDDITIQQITSHVTEHTFRQDLELLGIETALAYDNASLYMSRAFWPEKDEDEWHNLSHSAFDKIASNYSPFSAFDRDTISESDARVRGFLSREFTSGRKGDVITIELPEFDDTSSFILRTHNEDVLKAKGAEVRKIEDDAFLIIPSSEKVEIRLFSKLTRMLYPEVGF